MFSLWLMNCLQWRCSLDMHFYQYLLTGQLLCNYTLYRGSNNLRLIKEKYMIRRAVTHKSFIRQWLDKVSWEWNSQIAEDYPEIHSKEVTIQKKKKASAFLWIREEICLAKVMSLRAWQGDPILLMNNSYQVMDA